MDHQRIFLTGSHGLIGNALMRALERLGYEVVPLVRSPKQNGLLWDPERGIEDAAQLQTCSALIHLAGESVAGRRWSTQRKGQIVRSRVRSTERLVDQLAKVCPRPKTFICASAVGYYGECGDEPVTESAPSGRSFLASTCVAWEAAAQAASTLGIRVVNARFGMVLSKEGGALQKLLTPFRLGLGGSIGSGKQYWSWIALPELVQILIFLLQKTELEGPVNCTTPNPVRQREFAEILARQLHRPALMPLPAPLARLIFGEMADEMMLTSCRALPEKLLRSGYQFQQPDLAGSLKELLA
jgi:uncharacterized protein